MHCSIIHLSLIYNSFTCLDEYKFHIAIMTFSRIGIETGKYR